MASSDGLGAGQHADRGVLRGEREQGCGGYAARKTQAYNDAQAYLALSAIGPDSLNPYQAKALNQLSVRGVTTASAQAALDDPQVRADYVTWKEGGAARTGLHALVVGLTGGLVQAGVTAAAGLGAALGGVTGASSAFNEDANNRQLHPVEIKWISDNAEWFAKKERISPAEAEKQLADQAFRQVQFGATGATHSAASAFRKQAGKQMLADRRLLTECELSW